MSTTKNKLLEDMMLYPDLYNLINEEEYERKERSKDLSNNLLGRTTRQRYVDRNRSTVGEDSSK